MEMMLVLDYDPVAIEEECWSWLRESWSQQ